MTALDELLEMLAAGRRLTVEVERTLQAPTVQMVVAAVLDPSAEPPLHRWSCALPVNVARDMGAEVLLEVLAAKYREDLDDEIERRPEGVALGVRYTADDLREIKRRAHDLASAMYDLGDAGGDDGA